MNAEDLFWLRLSREGKEPSRAQEARYYGDPAKHVQFEREKKGGQMDEDLKTKEIERQLHDDLENWLRWGRKKDWLPTSFRCPLGFLYKSTDVHEGAYRALPCDDFEAVKLERIIVSLPQRHRQAFVMHQLGKAEVNGMIRIVNGRDEKARLLGLHKSRYHEVVSQALNMVYRELQKINRKKA